MEIDEMQQRVIHGLGTLELNGRYRLSDVNPFHQAWIDVIDEAERRYLGKRFEKFMVEGHQALFFERIK